jgi:hypothetical protein
LTGWQDVKHQTNVIVGRSLHFPDKHEACNKQGFCGVNHLSRAKQKHPESQTHTYCYLQVKLFGKQQRVDLVIDAYRRNDVTRRNEQVKKNRFISLPIIRAVWYLANQELPFRGHDESSTS